MRADLEGAKQGTAFGRRDDKASGSDTRAEHDAACPVESHTEWDPLEK